MAGLTDPPTRAAKNPVITGGTGRTGADATDAARARRVLGPNAFLAKNPIAHREPTLPRAVRVVAEKSQSVSPRSRSKQPPSPVRIARREAQNPNELST